MRRNKNPKRRRLNQKQVKTSNGCAGRPAVRRRRSSGERKEALAAVIFLLPSFAGVMYFIFLPFLDVIRRSFLQAMNGKFAGLDNYKEIVANDAFRLAVGNTVRFLLICLPLLLSFSLLLSLLLSWHMRRIRNHSGTEKERGGWCGFIKTSYLIPVAVPAASIALLWRVLFHEKGLINAVAALAADAPPIDFINSGSAFYVLIFTYLWKNTGYDMVLWLAGLSGISDSLYEAASVDGAGELAKFRYITLPGLLPTFIMTAILSLINSFKVFREAYLISGNYPDTSIYMLQHLLNNWFAKLDIQKMCAAAVVIAAFVLTFVLILQRLERRGENGQD